MNKLFLSKEIYPLPLVKEAITDYCLITVISLIEKENYYEVLFQESKYPIEQTMNEFENYVIGLVCKKL